MNIGERIVALRTEKDINQSELAKKVNIHPSVMNRIELGTRPVRDDELKAIAKALNVSADYLLGLDTKNAKTPSDLNSFLEKTEIMFDGETMQLDEEDRQKLRNALEFVFWEAKKKNKRKK